MAKTVTSKSVSLTVRVPIALHEAIKARMDATPPPVALAGTVVNLLWRGLAARDELNDAQEAVAARDREIDRLTKALTARVKPNPAIAALRSDPANRIIDPNLTQSVGHPVLTSAVPTAVAGNVGWCGLKGQDKAKGKKS